ncbi:hypothetical protein [Paenibacillus fonticola]|uniref:hypothetical protein n=1 Tax=Paenibacillus fonticola TaxID=379896 RepID=UPI00036B667D|nr:hypothetical protein [Paenibacillus fonticola]
MKNSINKYLFYLGISLVIIIVMLGLVFNNEKPKYTLIVYNYPASNEDLKQEYLEKIKDPNNRISGYSIGVLDVPDKRINVTQTPLYVIVNIKNRDIMFATDHLNKLNEYIINEIK